MSVAVAPAPLISPSDDDRRPRVWRTILGTLEGRVSVTLGAVMVIVIAVGRFAAPYPPDKIGVAIPGSPPVGGAPAGRRRARP